MSPRRTRKQPKQTRQTTQTAQRGGDEFLTHNQHAHLKLTLRRMGPDYFRIEDVWNYANQTAKKATQIISSPDLIFQYVFMKTQSPENTSWSLVGNEYIRYLAPKFGQSGYAVKNIFTHRNRREKA